MTETLTTQDAFDAIVAQNFTEIPETEELPFGADLLAGYVDLAEQMPTSATGSKSRVKSTMDGRIRLDNQIDD